MGISYNDYEPTERKEREVEETADFVVNFRRLPDYNGEFGFDWMRDNYKEICADYEKLKCEYTPEVINDAEYFVPWISMFPNQQNVKLKLEIDLKTDTLKDDDIIKLPSKNGISFEPNQIKALEIDGKEIKVNCSTPLTNDVVIDLLDQDNKIIGKLNFLKNSITHNLPIRIIKVIDGDLNQTINEKVFDEFSNNEKLEEVKDFIKNKGLNQALIVPNFENIDYNSIKELPVDLKELSKNGLVEFITPTSTQAHFLKGKKDELRDFLIVEQDKLYGSYKGIIIFVTVIHSENIEAGFSWVLPRENNVVIIPDGLFHGHTYLHEISHALGLEHTFSTTNSNDFTIEIMKKNITIYKDNIEKRQEFVNRYKNNKSTEIINFSDKTKKSVKEIREEGNAEIINQNKLLVEEESNLNDTIIVSNKYYFPQASTDNIMDYGKNYDTNILNSNTVNNTFHKYQILLIQDGLKITLK